jgi:hypothetical protein
MEKSFLVFGHCICLLYLFKLTAKLILFLLIREILLLISLFFTIFVQKLISSHLL